MGHLTQVVPWRFGWSMVCLRPIDISWARIMGRFLSHFSIDQQVGEITDYNFKSNFVTQYVLIVSLWMVAFICFHLKIYVEGIVLFIYMANPILWLNMFWYYVYEWLPLYVFIWKYICSRHCFIHICVPCRFRINEISYMWILVNTHQWVCHLIFTIW